MTAPASSETGLRRVVTRWELVGIAINDVIGSGVYLLPAAAAALLGPASLWAVLLAGGAVLLLVLCFAEAASHFDEPGSGYVYTREAFGPFIGFEVGWMTWLARVASVASLSNGFAQAMTFVACRPGGPSGSPTGPGPGSAPMTDPAAGAAPEATGAPLGRPLGGWFGVGTLGRFMMRAS